MATKMETVIHTYLTRLRIISKIPSNGKIDITNNDLNIYYNSIPNWIRRKIQGDNKDNATKYLMDLYREINEFSDQLMYNINTEDDPINKRKKIIMLVSLAEKIKESLMGIRNLIGTYKDYLKTVSLLECLEQDIIIPQFRVLKSFIPDSYHTTILKSSIHHPYVHNVNTKRRSLSENNPSDPESPLQINNFSAPTKMEDKPEHTKKNIHSKKQTNGNYDNGSTHSVSRPININR